MQLLMTGFKSTFFIIIIPSVFPPFLSGFWWVEVFKIKSIFTIELLAIYLFIIFNGCSGVYKIHFLLTIYLQVQ